MKAARRGRRDNGLDAALWSHLEELLPVPPAELLERRYERFRYIDSLIGADPRFGPKVGL